MRRPCSPPVARSGGKPKVEAAEKAYQDAILRAVKALNIARTAYMEAKMAAEEAYEKAIKESEK